MSNKIPDNTSSNGIQFNNGGALGSSSSLSWDNTNLRLGVGTNAPAYPVHVINSTSAGMTLESYGGGASLIRGRTAGGTLASPTASALFSELIALNGYAYNGSAFVGGGSLILYTQEAWGATNNGTSWYFSATATGTTGSGFVFAIFAGTGTANYFTANSAASGQAPYLGSGGSDTNVNLGLVPKGTGTVVISGGITMNDATNIAVGTTTGTRIGTATTQKLGFYGTTPVVQASATTELGSVLSSLGLRASGTTYTINTSGNIIAMGALEAKAAFYSNSGTITSATTLSSASSTEYQLCNATSASFTVTLPSLTTAGLRFTIKKIDSSANAVTVAGTIDGATNYTLATQYKYVTLISTTTSGTWYVVGNN